VISPLDGSTITLSRSTSLPAAASNVSVGKYGLFGGHFGDFSHIPKKDQVKQKSKDHGKIIQADRHRERRKWSHH
jgi:hypothetical protein